MTESNIVKVDNVDDFIGAVKDKIKKMLFDSIPDGSIEELVKKEYEAYFMPRTIGDRYGDTKKIPSKFEEVVGDIISKELDKALNIYITDFARKAIEKDGNEMFQKLLTEVAPMIQQKIMAQTIETALMNFQGNSFLQPRGY